MDSKRFKIERERIQRGLFRSYDPEKYYRYEEDAAYFPEDKFKKGLHRFANLFRAENRQKAVERVQEGKQQAERGLENVTNDNSIDTSPSSPRNLSPLPATVWWKVAIAATVFSFIPFFTPSGTIGSVAAGVFFISWIGLPIALYEDAKITTAVSDGWSPQKWLYVIGAIIPLLSGIVGALYLVRRWNHNHIAVPDDPVDDVNDEEALLRQRYARGEIDLTEFENCLENLLETESTE